LAPPVVALALFLIFGRLAHGQVPPRPIQHLPSFPLGEVDRQSGFAFPITEDPARYRLNVYLTAIGMPGNMWSRGIELGDGTFRVNIWRRRKDQLQIVDSVDIPRRSFALELYSVRAGGQFVKGDVLIVAYTPGLLAIQAKSGQLGCTPMASEVDVVTQKPLTRCPSAERF
jgi:hypothetical protein